MEARLIKKDSEKMRVVWTKNKSIPEIKWFDPKYNNELRASWKDTIMPGVWWEATISPYYLKICMCGRCRENPSNCHDLEGYGLEIFFKEPNAVSIEKRKEQAEYLIRRHSLY